MEWMLIFTGFRMKPLGADFLARLGRLPRFGRLSTAFLPHASVLCEAIFHSRSRAEIAFLLRLTCGPIH